MLFDDPDGAAARTYRVERTPYAFFIENGRIGSHGVANNAEHIRDLVEGRMSVRKADAWREIESNGNSEPGEVAAGQEAVKGSAQ
jgi:archaellum component FlaG (FlaF/FlaG flagellin family)